MIVNIESHLNSIYIDQLKTWTKISQDKANKISMIISEQKAFDFDQGIVKLKYKRNKIEKDERPDQPKCVDGISIRKEIFFIEFKNGKMREELCEELRLKATETLCEFNKILLEDKVNISKDEFFQIPKSFILVYNPEKVKNTNPNQNHLNECINFTNIKYFLKKFEGFYYNEVIVMSIEDFKKYFLKEN